MVSRGQDAGNTIPRLSGGAPVPVRWGILGTAHIALDKVIPAMRHARWARVVAIASRSADRARVAAEKLGIQRAYGDYDELLADPEIEAIYNPLPNHLHVPWTLRAARAGKHVLCEKPIALNAAQARELLAARDQNGVHMGEAFMVRTHPQWLAVRERVHSGRIGELRLITCQFSYFKSDPEDIRNRADYGGGGLLDIGCYPITLSRWLYGAEPLRVVSLIDRDPAFHIDRLTSALLQFPSGQAIFSCATQLAPYQRLHVHGTRARMEIEIPFNAPPDRPCRIFIDDGRDVFGSGMETVTLPTIDQYTVQAEQFSRAVRGLEPVPVSLEDAIANMDVIDALFRSAETGRWEALS
ncbi:MAG: Gfo/Idh/MocA family protein [Longimicrobiales bacterium]